MQINLANGRNAINFIGHAQIIRQLKQEIQWDLTRWETFRNQDFKEIEKYMEVPYIIDKSMNYLKKLLLIW